MTLRHWHDRFMARIDEARRLYDERFCRMWRFYLIASEVSFTEGHQVVFQIQLARCKDAVPLTRDYLYPAAAPMPASRAAE
jgi:cyclopropane-fatty-acyl-phospholipid synthase